MGESQVAFREWLSSHESSLRSSRVPFWEPAYLADVVRQAHAEGIATDWREATYVARLFGAFVVAIPLFVAEFIRDYVSTRPSAQILDPVVSFGSASLLMATCEASLGGGIGVVRQTAELELIQLFNSNPGIQWRLGGSLDDVDRSGFDLVVTAPPFGLHSVERTYDEAAERPFQLREEEGLALLVDAATRLRPEGEAIAIVPAGFFLRRPRGARAALNAMNFTVSAALAIPEGAFGRISVPTYLTVIRRSATTELFVGQLQASGNNQELLANLRARRRGAIPELGRLVDPTAFPSWRSVLLAEQLAEVTAGRDLEAHRLSDIGEIHRGRSEAVNAGFAEEQNAVYLPLIGNSPAVTRLSDLHIKPHNYAQIVLRPEVALAEYAAVFFNSELGLKVREAALSGFTIPKISAQTLTESMLYVPPLDVQREVAETQRTIRELELSLATQKRRLWERPEDVHKVKETLERLNQKQSLNDWLDGLPFPIGSILWRYVATQDAHHKVLHLLHFFEATAQFVACVLLSGLHSDPPFFETHRREWFPDPNRDDLRRATFGTWVVLGSRLASSVRSMLASDETRPTAHAMFRLSRGELILALSSKDLFDVLERTKDYRNEWVGHGGVEGNSERQRRLGVLEEELTRLRSIVAGAFEHTQLLQPRVARLANGIYYYTATSLTGTRAIFREVEVRVSSAMEDGRNYLLESESLAPLELLPFVKMMASPENEPNACFFYNRLERGGVRFVSYHFDQEAERVQSDPGLVALLEELRAP